VNNQEYLDFVQQNYFSYCKDQSVLEIGPNNGDHTRLIVKEFPKSLDVIEADSTCKQHLEKFNINNIVIDDAQHYLLENKKEYDVVVCCGVLYHLHNPLTMLEIIVNQCEPKQVILDCVEDQKNLAFLVEEDNNPGMRFLRPKWKSAGFNLVAPFDIINKSMYNMQYSLVKKDILYNTEWVGKHNIWMGIWERMNNG